MPPESPAEAADERNGPHLDTSDLESLLGFHVRMANVAIYRDFSAAMVELDLTQKQCATLQLINRNPSVSQIDLAAILSVDRATMMAVVARLEERELVARKPSSVDRRRRELFLTPVGQAVLKRAQAIITEHERRFTSLFTTAELDLLVGALRRIYQAT